MDSFWKRKRCLEAEGERKIKGEFVMEKLRGKRGYFENKNFEKEILLWAI